MRLPRRLEAVAKLFRQRPRRTAAFQGIANIEFRGIASGQLVEFGEHVRERVASIPGVQWAEVNPHIRRVVVAFQEQAVQVDALVASVEEAERLTVELPEAGPAPSPGPPLDAERDLPDDDDLALQRALELVAEAAGLWMGLVFRFIPFTPATLGANAVAVLSLVQTTPGLRQKLDERFGRDRADLLLNLAIASGQALAERPLSSLVGMAQKVEALRELRAKRRVYRERMQELFSKPAGLPLSEFVPDSRPCDLPKGPVERHTDRAWLLGLASFSLSLATTRSLRSSVAALFGALPGPARVGREAFALELGRVLADRGTLVLAAGALRRLDRVDCLVLQGDLVSPTRFSLGALVPRSDVELAAVEGKVRGLFRPERPLQVQRRGNWALGPPTLLGAASNDEIDELARGLTRRGELVLALSNGSDIVALQQVEILRGTGTEELIDIAERAEMRIVLSSEDESTGKGLDLYDTIPGGSRMAEGIRALQRQGRVVCLVATSESSGLPAADCAIAVTRPGKPPPWGAHIVCGEDLSMLSLLMRACLSAREVSVQSVRLALAAAAVGTLVSGGGILRSPSRRVMFVVNAASLVAIINGMGHAAAVGRQQTARWLDPTPWHALDAEGVLTRLRSSAQGISHAEARARLAPQQREAPALARLWRAVYSEASNPLTPLLVAGAGLSALVGSTADAAMVAAAGGITALVGGVQRFRTERAIHQLVRRAQHPVRVWRNSALIELDPADGTLVPGDVIALGSGDVIPADCRVLEAQGLEVDASSFTGESLPVVKTAAPSYQTNVADRECILYAGTSVAAGKAKAVVVAVGQQTAAHRAALSTDASHSVGGVEMRLRSLMQLTGPVAAAAGASLMSAGLLRGKRLEELVETGVSLAVAAVPEGLPLLATAAQVSAAQRLSRRGIMVRNPRCVEALGRVDLICLDKTGTLTEGQVELHAISDGLEEQPVRALGGEHRHVLEAALRSSAAPSQEDVDGDAIDKAVGRGAASAGLAGFQRAPGQRLSELPFQAVRGYYATSVKTQAGSLVSFKGAPELILRRCSRWRPGGREEPLSSVTRAHLRDEVERLTRTGLRVLAAAERRFEEGQDAGDLDRVGDLTFLGFLLFRDRVRPTAKVAIAGLRQAGLRVVMLTGDHANTARSIAEELGMGGEDAVVSGGQLARMGDEELAFRLARTTVFARVTPAQKVRVVRALQGAGHVVAMAGDGANDAASIRAADVGLSVGERSTGVARGAADIVLADARIERIVDAIVEARAMWASVREAVSILVGGNLGEIAYSVGAGLLSGRPPLSPRQLLLVNFMTDIAPAMAIAVRPPAQTDLAALADEGPEASLGSPLNREIAGRALVTAAGAATAWYLGRLTGSRERADTIGLAALVCTQLGQTLVSGGPSAPVVLTSVGSAAALAGIVQLPVISRLFGCRPLGPLGWATALGASAAATGASVLLPDLTRRATDRVREISVQVTGVPGPTLAEREPAKGLDSGAGGADSGDARALAASSESGAEMQHDSGGS